MKRLLAQESPSRSAVIGAGIFVALLVFTQLLLPGDEATGINGTPAGILFQGVIYGLLNALVAAGVVLIFRTARIINFAQGAMGGAGGVFTYNLVILAGLPFLLAFVAGVGVAALVGVVIELAFVRRFFDSPRLVLTVITIALVGFLGFVTGFIDSLPIFPEAADRDIDALPDRMPMPFPGFEFQFGKAPLTFGFEHLFAISASVIALLALALFLRRTKAGVAIRASAENADRAVLLGINVKSLSTLVWTIAGALSGVGVIATSAITGASLGVGSAPILMLNALAAAVIAKMRSLPVAAAAAIGIQTVRYSVIWSFPGAEGFVDVALFFVVLVGLILQRQRLQRSEAQEVSTWKAVEEQRAIPKEMLAIPGIRAWRLVLIGLGLAVVGLFPWAVTTRTTNVMGSIFLFGIVVISLVVLTGWAGQVSLGQVAFVAAGAIAGAALVEKAGVPFWIALFAGGLVSAALALLIGLPALRIRGLFLGIATFAFAFAAEATMFREDFTGGLIPDVIDRPTLLLLNFEDERSMYYLSLAALVLVIVLVSVLRRSRLGRVLIGLRDNETNVQSFGVNLVRTKLAAFAFSGFLSGFAGVLFAFHQKGVDELTFGVENNINLFLFAVVGGIGSVTGALLGASYFALTSLLAENELAGFFLGPVGILFILYAAPGGLSGLVFAIRDAVLRIVAQRRRMVVPSLFADLDPDAVANKLAPLAESIPNAGIAALPADQRYKMPSYIHGKRKTVSDGASALREAALIGSVAESLEAEQEDGQ